MRVSVEVNPNEVRRHYAESLSRFEPSTWDAGTWSHFVADVLRQVLDQLPKPKFKIGDRVVRIRAGDDDPSPDVGRIGTVTGAVNHFDDRLYVLMDGDTIPIHYNPDTLVRIVEDGDRYHAATEENDQ